MVATPLSSAQAWAAYGPAPAPVSSHHTTHQRMLGGDMYRSMKSAGFLMNCGSRYPGGDAVAVKSGGLLEAMESRWDTHFGSLWFESAYQLRRFGPFGSSLRTTTLSFKRRYAGTHPANCWKKHKISRSSARAVRYNRALFAAIPPPTGHSSD